MAIDYMEAMGLLAGMTTKHPQTTALALQTYSLWNGHANDIAKIQAEYQAAAGKANGMLDQIAILAQLAAMHPWFRQLLVQTLSQWQTRISDGIEMINEFQNAAEAANKT